LDEQGESWIGLPVTSDAEVVAATRDTRASWQSALAALAAGAHAADVTRPITADVDALLNLLHHRALCNIATFEVRALRQAGETTRAVQVSLGALTMGAVFVRDGILIHQMVGAALLAITMRAWPEDALALLDDDALSVFANGLSALDDLLPDHLVMDRELLFTTKYLLAPTDANCDGDWGAIAAWRYGFSTRWMIADGFLQTDEYFALLASAPAGGWPARCRQHDRISDDAEQSANPLLAMQWPTIFMAEKSLMRTLTELRLLRLAIDAHRGLDPAPLPDPLGSGPFACEQSGDAVTWTSAGAERPDELTRTVRR
jgi:hypothetical protein